VRVAEVEDEGNIARSNTLRNSLFFRDFSREVQVGRRGAPDKLLIEYSTPVDIPAIEALTAFYWRVVLVVWVAITVAFGLALRTIILPIRRVMGQVQERGADLLRRPASALERGYNAVATEALAARLSQRVTDLVQTPSLWTSAEFDPPMIEAVRQIFGFQAAALIAVEPTSPQVHFRALEVAPGVGQVETELRKVRIEWERLDPEAPPHLLRRTGEALGHLAAVAPLLETASSRLGLIIVDAGDWSSLARWQRQVFEAAAAEVRRGLVQMPVFRDYLFRQKSQANISLARNLGHDLTNVIATSKFDILAIQTWLEKRLRAQTDGGDAPSRREMLLGESVQGLLNTTKFMQEIVNIYRAFSYMDEPRWERIDFNALVSHLCQLFRLTLGRRVEVVEDLDPLVPEVLCEPRLVQLALFNLLTNANQAIKGKTENAAGTITVATRPAEENLVEIRVRDSGAGIRGADGRLLDGEELYKVFFLGITTRREGEERGEGLGLNWVWSIIRDFHGGGVEPTNHPEGGAEFRLTLPVDGAPGSAAEETATDETEDATGVEETA
jgi:signal transduction histidine kinase